MSGHTVVAGFGVTGVNAAQHMLGHGADPGDVVVVDRSPTAIDRAAVFGAHGILGDGTDRRVLAQAISERVRCVIVAVEPDATAVLITMLARELCPTATIVTALRESSHMPFARRHGADHVVITAEATGKSLGQNLNPSEPRLSR